LRKIALAATLSMQKKDLAWRQVEHDSP